MPRTPRDEITKLQEEYARHPEGRLFVHLADAYRRSGDLERARDLLQQGLQQHDDYLSARILLAEVHTEMGEAEQARVIWREVLEQDPENERALRAAADLAYLSGHHQEALTHFRRLQEIGMDDDEVRALVRELDTALAAPEADAPPLVEPPPAAEKRIPDPGEAAPSPAPVAAPAPRQPLRGPQAAPDVQTDVIGLIQTLVRLLEYGDSVFNADSSLTHLLALAIGRELELEPVQLDALALAALLSDLGGLALHEPARARPNASDEGAARCAEPREGAISLQLLQGIPLPAGVREAIRHQHERWDGSGHPDGLREEEIPLGARVLAVAHGCAAMLLPHDGHRGKSVTSALDELQRHAGARYDPGTIDVLHRVFQRRLEHGIGYGAGGRIIILHPEELRRLELATQLHNRGYVVEMTSELSRARERLGTSPTQAVVVGANLPRDDVARLIRDVRSDQAHPGVPVIVIDADDMDSRVEYLMAGADVCFSSDLSFREFLATLVSLLRRAEQSSGAAPPPMEGQA